MLLDLILNSGQWTEGDSDPFHVKIFTNNFQKVYGTRPPHIPIIVGIFQCCHFWIQYTCVNLFLDNIPDYNSER